MAVPPEALAGSSAPLALVFTDAPEAMQISFTAIAVVATVNGVLIQMIMVSRIIYGMADRGRLPAGFARLPIRTQTPSVATAFVAICILGLSLFLPIARLAEWTSQIVLSVFVCVNLALIAIKRRAISADDHFSIPLLVPVCGTIISGILLVVSLF